MTANPTWTFYNLVIFIFVVYFQRQFPLNITNIKNIALLSMTFNLEVSQSIYIAMTYCSATEIQ